MSADPTTSGDQRSLLAFLKTETGGAALLLLATVVALVWANSPASGAYEDLWATHLDLGLVDESLAHWVNDGLMVWFFYVVGLEIRRELVLGDLRDRRAAAIPAIAALAGMVVPALVFFAFNAGGPGAGGWGIVMATDIAFVLGALALLGDRVPPGVRVFLLTLAIVDDIGAIAVIALFYTAEIDLVALGAAAAILAAIVVGRRVWPVWRAPVYLVAGLCLWFAMLKSGVHPTIAGVLMGVLTAVYAPRSAAGESDVSPNERFQAAIHPWTSYVVIPIFALANAGVSLSGDVLGDALTSPVFLGVVAGLVLGKAVGISVASLGAVRARVGPLPTGVDRGHVLGAATLAGIGFTVSLFVAELAFTDQALRDQAKIGVLAASVLAAALGLTGLARARRAPAE